METDKENTSLYLQTSFQSPAVANYGGTCPPTGAGRVKTMRPLTSGMAASESEVITVLVNFCFCSQFWTQNGP